MEQEAQREISLKASQTKALPFRHDRWISGPGAGWGIRYLPFAAIRSFSAAAYLRKPPSRLDERESGKWFTCPSPYSTARNWQTVRGAPGVNKGLPYPKKSYGPSGNGGNGIWEIIGFSPMKQSSKPPWEPGRERYCSITAAAYNVPPVWMDVQQTKHRTTSPRRFSIAIF